MDGFRNDKGKVRMDLLPPEVLFGAAEVLTIACESGEYPERNWEQGMRWGRVFGSLMRHAWAFWRGEERDPKTGLPHVAHLLTNAIFLYTYYIRAAGTDDRPTTVLKGTTETSKTPDGMERK